MVSSIKNFLHWKAKPLPNNRHVVVRVVLKVASIIKTVFCYATGLYFISDEATIKRRVFILNQKGLSKESLLHLYNQDLCSKERKKVLYYLGKEEFEKLILSNKIFRYVVWTLSFTLFYSNTSRGNSLTCKDWSLISTHMATVYSERLKKS